MPELMREGMFETVAVVEVGMPTVGGVMGALYSLFYRVIGSTMDISTRTQSGEKDDCDFENILTSGLYDFWF